MIEAKDGVPGAFSVDVPIGASGPWTFEAHWQGRGLATLKLTAPDGRVVMRRSGGAPLGFVVDIAPEMLRSEPFALRFETAMAKGVLAGTLRIVTPEAPRAMPLPSDASLSVAGRASTPAPEAWRGPGRCFVPALADDASGRGLQRLGAALESASPLRRAWATRWGAEIATLSDTETGDGSIARGRLDRLWRQLDDDDAAKDDEVTAGVRAVLAALEDIVRREENASDSQWASLRSRRREVLQTLRCLGSSND